MTKFAVLSRTTIEDHWRLWTPDWVFSAETLRILTAKAVAQKWIGYEPQTLQMIITGDHRPQADRARNLQRVGKIDSTAGDAVNTTVFARSGNSMIELLDHDPAKPHPHIAKIY